MGRGPLVALLAAAAGFAAASSASGGGRATECLAAFVPSAGDARRIRCVDGDPACDADPTPGICRFDVSVCLNLADPKLRCAPGEIERYDIENVQPDTDPYHDFEFGTLQAAVDVLGFPVEASETDLCSGPVAMTLPLEVRVQRRGAGYRSSAKTLRADVLGAGPPLDRDSLPMKCVPARGSDPCQDISSSFDQIERHVLPGCTRDTCHNSAAGGHGLALVPGEAFAGLVGVAPRNSAAAAAGKLRVDPSQPGNSFLVDKLRGALAAGEGAPMPRGLPRLPERSIRLVEAWIEAGAPATGFVEGPGCQP